MSPDRFQGEGATYGGKKLPPLISQHPVTVPDGAPGPLQPPRQGWVRFRSVDLKTNVSVRMDETAPVLVPSLPRIEQVEIAYRATRTWWAGQTIGQLTISCMVDGFPYTSIEDDIAQIEDLAVPLAPGRATGGPAPVQIAGNVPGIDRLWQLTGITPGDAIWRNGVRVRQQMELELTQWVPLEKADTSGRRNPRGKDGKRKRRPDVVVRRGETLASIAADVLGSAARWRAIAQLNPYGAGKKKRKRTSPDDCVPGERLKMPNG